MLLQKYNFFTTFPSFTSTYLVMTNAPVAIYTIDGMKVEKPAKGGIYIMRFADGSCRKVMMK